MIKDAFLSADGTYRWWLSRIWAPEERTIAWVMLNPSTADAEKDDPTIRRCIAFTKAWGWGGLYVVNLFAYRATDPKAIRKVSFNDACGPSSEQYILDTTRRCARTILAWGTNGEYGRRGAQIAGLLIGNGRVPLCLGVTQNLQPRHPLYVPATEKPEPWLDALHRMKQNQGIA